VGKCGEFGQKAEISTACVSHRFQFYGKNGINDSIIGYRNPTGISNPLNIIIPGPDG
jgi:hypothetical protein